MNEKGRSLSYEDYINIFLITIIFGIIGILTSVTTGNFILFFISVIPGVMIDSLKLAAKIYLLNHNFENIKDKNSNNN